MAKAIPAVRVLVVDDDPAICDYMETFLAKDGFEVTARTDPEKVEKEIREGGYHIVVLDLMMPKMDGIEVLERIRKVDSDVAVIIFTGFPSLDTAVQSIKLDAADYLKKPFNPDEFREVLDRVMKKKGLARTPEESLHKYIGETIRGHRKSRGLTLKQMSRRTGLSVSLLSQIERAESSASISSLYKIASALEVHIAELFGDFLVEARAEEDGQTVAAHVRRMLDVPWSKAKALCSSGRVRVDGERALDPAARVPRGALVAVDPEGKRLRKGVLPDEAVVHLDAWVVVVDKPADTLTLPFEGDERDTLVDRVRALLARRGSGRKKQRDAFIGVVHRLDKDTTGVLVFARTMPAKRALEAQLREHTVGRRYLAIVHGTPTSKTHVSHLIQDRGDGLRGSWGTRPHHRGAPPADAKRSVTHVEVLERLHGASLVACRLETGRQHQIRIHLAEAGHPLVGERVYVRDYGAPRIEAPRPMLHALELAFDHPDTRERLTFRRDPPADFATLLRALRA